MKQHSALVRFFGLDKVYGRKYGVAFLLDPLLTIAAAVFFLQVVTQLIQIELSVFGYFISALLTLYFIAQLVKAFYARNIIRSRSYTLENHLKNTRIYSSAMNTELNNLDDTKLINLDSTSGMYDVTFNFYRKTKHGEYLSKQAFYTVYEIKLQRTLPHLVFDSKLAKGTQFKPIFLKAQKLSLDVNFDDYFEVYAPKTYQIDTLSFISPEVLQAMLSLKNYDIEIIDDSLLVFAPLLRNAYLGEFENECLKLYKALNDNLDTYIDQRLLGEHGRRDVTAFSKRLLENPNRYLVPLVLSGMASAIAAYIMMNDVLSIYLIIPVIMFAGYAGKMIKIFMTNIKLEEEFRNQVDFHGEVQKLQIRH